MGKLETRVVRVPKWATFILLVLTSAAMVALVWLLSGRAYVKNDHPLLETATRIMRYRQLTPDAILAGLMPVIANFLFFVPWGFLTFVAVDRPDRPRSATYAITCFAGIVFAMGVALWQYSLPTRVTTFADTVTNGFGTLAGATLGHLRKRIRVRFKT
ncbi:MAG: VanZ family protein [Acidobacteria bacterium]|nr:VanZ family protein [Acidobacteriota bacterium]